MEGNIWYLQVQRIFAVDNLSCGGYSFVEILFLYLVQMGIRASYLIEIVAVKVSIETEVMIGWSGSLFSAFWGHEVCYYIPYGLYVHFI